MAEFMMLFLNIKPYSTYKFDKSISKKAKQTLDCMRKYSSQKFGEIHRIREFRILIVRIYSYGMDELFSKSKTMQINCNRYIHAIEEFIDAK